MVVAPPGYQSHLAEPAMSAASVNVQTVAVVACDVPQVVSVSPPPPSLSPVTSVVPATVYVSPVVSVTVVSDVPVLVVLSGPLAVSSTSAPGSAVSVTTSVALVSVSPVILAVTSVLQMSVHLFRS